MMRKAVAALTLFGRWLGPMFMLLAVWLFLFPIGPWGDGSTGLALVGAIIAVITCVTMRAPERKRQRIALAGSALLGVLFYGWHTWNDHRGYREETVSFNNRGAHLVGTLYLPDERRGRFPGMVLLAGSGAVPRKFYGPIAASFAKKGFAVLIYDKRGVGDSSGVREARFFLDAHRDLEALASDAAVGLSFLASRREVRPDAVGFHGISEGGIIAPRAAFLNGNAAYLLINSATPASLYSVAEHQGGAKGLAEARLWFRKDFDPMVSLRALDIPSLWVLAGEDTLVSNKASIPLLEALHRQGKPIEYRVIPGAWHGLFIAPVKQVSDTVDPWLARVTTGGHESIDFPIGP